MTRAVAYVHALPNPPARPPARPFAYAHENSLPQGGEAENCNPIVGTQTFDRLPPPKKRGGGKDDPVNPLSNASAGLPIFFW